MKKGFSLAELLIAMTIIGLVSALSIPVIVRTLSAQHKQAYKAAYQNVNNIVNVLINDTTLYPTGEFSTGEDFCNQFFDKSNTIGTANCSSEPTVPGTPNITTLNGMRWYFPGSGVIGDFDSTCPDSAGSNCLLIYIDVNGNKGKNSYNDSNYDQRDILKIYVSIYGKVYLPETSAGPERSYMTN